MTRRGARLVAGPVLAAALAGAAVLGWASPAAAEVSGSCDAVIKGVSAHDRSSADPSQAIPVKPEEVVTYSVASATGVTDREFRMEYAGIQVVVDKGTSKGKDSFASGSAKVDDYAWLGAGLYKVIGRATLKDGSTCSGAVLIDVQGNPLTTVLGVGGVIAVVVGLIGVIRSSGVRGGELVGAVSGPGSRSDDPAPAGEGAVDPSAPGGGAAPPPAAGDGSGGPGDAASSPSGGTTAPLAPVGPGAGAEPPAPPAEQPTPPVGSGEGAGPAAPPAEQPTPPDGQGLTPPVTGPATGEVAPPESTQEAGPPVVLPPVAHGGTGTEPVEQAGATDPAGEQGTGDGPGAAAVPPGPSDAGPAQPEGEEAAAPPPLPGMGVVTGTGKTADALIEAQGQLTEAIGQLPITEEEQKKLTETLGLETIKDKLDQVKEVTDTVTHFEQVGTETVDTLNRWGLPPRMVDAILWFRWTTEASGRAGQKFVDGIVTPVVEPVTKALGEAGVEADAEEVTHSLLPVQEFAEEASKASMNAVKNVLGGQQRIDQIAQGCLDEEELAIVRPRW